MITSIGVINEIDFGEVAYCSGISSHITVYSRITMTSGINSQYKYSLLYAEAGKDGYHIVSKEAKTLPEVFPKMLRCVSEELETHLARDRDLDYNNCHCSFCDAYYEKECSS